VEGSDDRPLSKLSTGERPASGLIVVATPIGNAGDITLRALDLLRQAHAIACEDTRVTGALMARYGVATPLLAYHEHNAARMRPLLLERLRRGEAVALVSDAGTPLVSDPGYKLVRAAIEAGIPVTAAPGASAALAALVLSGLPSDRFLFAGFLPPRQAARQTELAALAAVPATLIFFESAGRLAETLADMATVLGVRDAAVARELTKLYEEVRRGSLSELAQHYGSADPPRGEIVIVVGPPAAAAEASDAAIDDALRAALANASLRDAVAAVAAALPAPRRRRGRQVTQNTAGRTRDRKAAFRRGRRGERTALWWLRLKGYRILAQDYRSPAGEIDVVARRGSTLAVIEVKARDSAAAAVEAILPRQRNRIFNAARLFVARHPRHGRCTIRFDIMLVTPGRWPRHIVNAWQIDQVI
jgi:16S rRNA (cytidine1402-2'-O)-methyltransferase